MEFRVLKYFLAAAEQENISKAAELLHVTQPTLSRQIMELEEELGVRLFIRGSRKLSLTEEGRLLKKRAEEISDLVDKTKSEVTSPDKSICGDIYIGGGEMDGMRFIAKAANGIIKEYPQIHIHLFSGDVYNVMERLDKGLLDFGVILEEKVSPDKYESLILPGSERWGVLMRKDSPISNYGGIKKEDLYSLPLILSRQGFKHKTLLQWFQKDISELNITATYNLIYNASLMVDEGVWGMLLRLTNS